jgi:hypothetical protein
VDPDYTVTRWWTTFREPRGSWTDWLAFRRPRGFWADWQFGWPFGRITLRADCLVFGASRPIEMLFEAMTRLVGKGSFPFILKLDSIDRLEVSVGIPVVTVRSDRRLLDGMKFGSSRRKLDPLLSRLAALGVEVLRES